MNAHTTQPSNQSDNSLADSAYAEIEMRQFRNEELAKVIKVISAKLASLASASIEAAVNSIQNTLKMPSDKSTHRS